MVAGFMLLYLSTQQSPQQTHPQLPATIQPAPLGLAHLYRIELQAGAAGK